MSGTILVVNPGSSNLKLSVLDAADATIAESDVETRSGDVDADALHRFLASAPRLDASGVRVVHGGADFTAPVVADVAVVERIEALAPLAPLHNPTAARALRLLLDTSTAPVVACFDTTFHASLPPAASTYAIPDRWRSGLGLRRFGFHGLSHAYASRRTAHLLGRPLAELGMVTCHLGAGASLAAVQSGASVDTTMGFTPMEGLVMATRSGSIDPGILLWLQREAGVEVDELDRALDRESGLLGLCGSADMRTVLAAAERDEPAPRLAVDVYVHRLSAGIAAMAVALHRLDAVVFTGGVGEHAASIRAAACGRLAALGIRADLGERHGDADTVLSPPRASVAIAVVRAREDLEIAREVRALLGSAPAGSP